MSLVKRGVISAGPAERLSSQPELDCCHHQGAGLTPANLPSEEFELTANSLGDHMKVTESSSGMGHGKLILRTFI